MKNFVRYASSIMIAAILVYYVVKDYSIGSLLPIIREMNSVYLILAIASMLGMYLLGGIRWKFLYPNYLFKQSVNGVVVAVAANGIVPMRGGEFIRALFLSKQTGAQISSILGKVIIERTTDMVSILSLLAISAAVLGKIIKEESGHILTLGIFAGSSIYLFLFAYKYYHKTIDEMLNSLTVKGKIIIFLKEKILSMLTPFKEMKFKRIMIAQILSFGIVFFGILLLYFSLLAVNISTDLKSIAVIFPLIVLSISLPISVAHIGVYHAAMIIALSYIQINDADLVGKVIVVHLLSIVPPILYGGVLLSLANLNLLNISKRFKSTH